MQDTQSKVIDSIQSNSAVRSIESSALVIAAGSIIVVVGLGIWAVSPWLPVVGYVAIGAAILTLVSCAAFPVVALLRFLFRRDFVEIGTQGTIDNWLWKTHVYAPLDISTKLLPTKSTERATSLPSISFFDLIEQGDIYEGMTEMVMGIDKEGKLIKDPWPRTYVIAGKGRSGKTRRTIAMVGQALLGMRAHVTICDPHATKRDSLTRELAPLAPWLHFASTPQEILQASRDFISEMEKRVHGQSTEVIGDGRYIPRVMVYDEWTRTMTNDTDLEDSERKEIGDGVRSASREYAGYDGFCCLIGQEWTEDSCGGTAIRRAMQAAFIHKLDPDYAKFFTRKSKVYNACDELTQRECFYKDIDGSINRIFMFDVPDGICMRIADMLKQIAPIEKRQELPTSEQTQQIARRDTGPLALPPVSYSPSRETISQAQNFVESEAKNLVNEPLEQSDTGETFTMIGEAFTLDPADNLYAHEKETKILLAAFTLSQRGNKVTRTGIMEHLGWTRKQWNVIKAVCDKHSIAIS